MQAALNKCPTSLTGSLSSSALYNGMFSESTCWQRSHQVLAHRFAVGRSIQRLALRATVEVLRASIGGHEAIVLGALDAHVRGVDLVVGGVPEAAVGGPLATVGTLGAIGCEHEVVVGGVGGVGVVEGICSPVAVAIVIAGGSTVAVHAIVASSAEVHVQKFAICLLGTAGACGAHGRQGVKGGQGRQRRALHHQRSCEGTHHKFDVTGICIRPVASTTKPTGEQKRRLTRCSRGVGSQTTCALVWLVSTLFRQSEHGLSLKEAVPESVQTG